MINKFYAGMVAVTAMFFLTVPTQAWAATDSSASKIQRFTKKLKKLPNRAAPAGVVRNLVRKLSRLRPIKSDQYYALGLRKLGVPGAAGAAFARRLNADVQKIANRANLPSNSLAKLLRRLNKTERLYTPLPEPPPPYQASASPALTGLV
jgi:hypothetical protein